MDNQAVITAQGVTKRFGDFVAVNHVDFEIRENEVLGIIGPNGAGKTTFLNLITGYYTPDQGSLFAYGKDITRMSPAKRVNMGIARTFQLVHVFDNLSVFDNLALSYYRRKEGKSLSFGIFFVTLQQELIYKRVIESLKMLNLGNSKDELTANLPLGSKKKLELAMAFAADPKVLLLDEPFSGLGDREIDEVIGVLKKYIHHRTVLIIEHKVSKLADLVDRLAVMHEGRIITCGECEETLNNPEVRKVYWKIDTIKE